MPVDRMAPTEPRFEVLLCIIMYEGIVKTIPNANGVKAIWIHEHPFSMILLVSVVSLDFNFILHTVFLICYRVFVKALLILVCCWLFYLIFCLRWLVLGVLKKLLEKAHSIRD